MAQNIEPLIEYFACYWTISITYLSINHVLLITFSRGHCFPIQE